MGWFDTTWSHFLTPVSSLLYSIRKAFNDGSAHNLAAHDNYDPESQLYFGQFADLENELRAKGLGSLVDANRSHWINSFNTYSPGVLDSIASSIGGRSGRDKYYEKIINEYGQSLQDLANMGYQNDYNSEVEKAARMRAAGENPDLLGTGDVANSAAPAEDADNTLADTSALTADSALSWASSFGQFMFTLPSMVTGLIKDSKTIKGLSIANESGEVGNLAQILGIAQTGVLSSVGHNDVGLAADSDVGLSRSLTAQEQLLQGMDTFLGNIKGHVSSKTYKKIKAAADAQVDGMLAETGLNRGRVDYFDSRIDRTRSRGSKYYGGDDGMYDDFLDAINAPLIQMSDAITEFTLKKSKFEFMNSAEYQEKFNSLGGPDVAAGFDVANPTAQLSLTGATTGNTVMNTAVQDLNKKIQEANNSLTLKLKELADSGNRWAKIGLGAIQVWQITNPFAAVLPGAKTGGLSFGLR